MNTQKGNAIVIAVVVLVILIGGGWLLFNRNSEDGAMTDDKMDGESMMDDTSMKVPAPGHEDVDEMIVNDGGSMTPNQDKSGTGQMDDDEMMMEDEMMMDDREVSFAGSILAGSATPLIDFNKADYDKALREKKLVVLYFYANWCPICKQEVASGLLPAFNELNEKEVVGFRVNYNDNQTDSDEKNLAKEFGVAYQHTKVFLKDGERVLKSPEGWNKERYLEEVNKALN